MKKSLLFIDHQFHQKTRSTDFIKEVLAEDYQLEYFYYFPGKEKELSELKSGQHFDVVVLFQVMPDIDQLKQKISFDKCVFFPMYDGCLPRWNPKWLTYQDVIIISFCKKLHLEFQQMGLTSFYIQYFPKPLSNKPLGDSHSVFFWDRITQVNLNLLNKILPSIQNIHCHKVLDPDQKFIKPPHRLHRKITYSHWFKTKEKIQEKMCQSALYFAPRLEEGIGMGFLEAMAMGRCVIAPNNPTMNEYIIHGKTGFLYDSDSPKEIPLNNLDFIQKQAALYIEQGYENFIHQKKNILAWMQEKTKQGPIRLLPEVHPSFPKIEIKLFHIFSFIKIKKKNNSIKIWMFGIPFLKIKKKGE